MNRAHENLQYTVEEWAPDRSGIIEVYKVDAAAGPPARPQPGRKKGKPRSPPTALRAAGLTVLDQSQAQDSDAIVVTQQTAAKYGLKTITDLAKAHATASELRAGTVWINDPLTDNDAGPFGGFKRSGLGRELARAERSLLDGTPFVQDAAPGELDTHVAIAACKAGSACGCSPAPQPKEC